MLPGKQERVIHFTYAMETKAAGERNPPHVMLDFFRSEGVQKVKLIDIGGSSKHVVQRLAEV